MKSVFGKPDRRIDSKTGEEKICSEYPAWMQDSSIRELEADMDTREGDINGGYVPHDEVFGAKQALNDIKERYDDIVRSKPRYSQSEEQIITEELDKVTNKVTDTLYSRYDQLKGKGSIARPQREADLNDFPCIEINPEIAKMFNLCGMSGGKVSRNQADKFRKIACAYFGRDDASREAIRPENNTNRRPMVGYVNERFAKRFEEIHGEREIPNFRNSETEAKSPSKDILKDNGVSVKERLATAREKFNQPENQDNGKVVEKVKPVEKAKRVKRTPDISWQCEEEGCTFKGITRQKGAHMARHGREKKLALAAKE